MKHFKKLGNIFIAMILVFLLVACGGAKEDAETTETTTEATTESAESAGLNEGKIVDREGNTVELPEKADKIISLSPSITETLVNLGLSDKLIAVDKYSKEIEGVNQELPIFDIMAPDTENIVLLEPDIIFGTGMSKSDGSDPFAPMVEMGAFVTVVPTSTNVQGIIEDIEFIGKVTKTEDKAQEIIDNYNKELNEIIEKIKEANVETGTPVYFEAAGENWTFGGDVFLNDMIELLGAKNIFSEEIGWNEPSAEQVIAKNPAVILTNTDYIEDPVGAIKSREGWEVIDAIKNDRVYFIGTNSSKRANENSIIAFKEIAKAIYPDLFTE